MRLAFFPLALLAVAFSVVAAQATTRGLTPHPDLLVSGDWLAKHLDAPEIRVVDLREPRDFADGHIPGAVNLPLGALLTVRDGVPAMLPPVKQAVAVLARAGIGRESVVVGYDDSGGLGAARLFWTLDYLGHKGGRVLDGGWGGWLASGRPLSVARPPLPPGGFQPRVRPETLADRRWVLERLNDRGVALVDARSRPEYEGLVRYADRGGHIPGAIGFDWNNHLRPDRPGFMKPASELLEAYRAQGLSPDKEIAVYCQVNLRAAHAYFVLRWLGYPHVRAYDGSWAEWGNRPDTPVEKERPAALPLHG